MKTLCNCCEPPHGIDTELTNRPSLSAIAYRIGTFSQFRAAMLDEIADHPELAHFTTRDSDDYGITILEMWAAVADVLTFYQERYANEAFLRTAAFQDSVARVASLIGYRPRPGVAARAWLAFRINSEAPVRIPVGQRVQSVPGQDEEPQTFEALEEILAFRALNEPRIFPVPQAANPLAHNSASVMLDLLDGPQIAEPLGADQKVVIFKLSSAGVLGTAVSANQVATAQSQVVANQVQGVSAQSTSGVQRFLSGSTFGPGQQAVQQISGGGFGQVAAQATAATGFFEGIVQGTIVDLFPGVVVLPSAEPVEEKKIGDVEIRDHRVVLTWDKPIQKSGWTAASRAYRYRRTLRIFGHNAPKSYVRPAADPANPTDATKIIWNFETRSDAGFGPTSFLHLDGRHEDLQVGQELLISDTGLSGKNTLVKILDVDQVQHVYEPLTDTVTRLRVSPQVPAVGDRANVVIYELVGPRLRFAPLRYASDISGDAVYLPGVVTTVGDELGVEVSRPIERNEFKPGSVVVPSTIEGGRKLILQDADGEPVAVTVREIPTIIPASAGDGDACHLKILVDSESAWSVDTETAVLRGNVSESSHGETVSDELLGSGDAAQTFQRFALKKGPLTYLPAPGAAGVQSTLDLSVGGTRWTEVSELYGQSPTAPVVEAGLDPDGTAVVRAGDGVFGALLPTAADVRATYRVGSGLVGRVGANSLTTLLQRPPGLTDVSNPLAAEGGADPETLETSRLNAPRGVRTFGRIVSIQDFQDQVTLSGEVAKALATPVWDGLDQAIHLTVAGQAGALFSPTALADLGQNLESVRDPNHRLRLDNYAQIFVEVHGGIGVTPDTDDPDEVLAEARQAIIDALSFDALSLGQPINLSDMYRVIQDVPGVGFVDIDRFMFKTSAFGGFWQALIELWRRGALGAGWTVDPVQSRLQIFSARPDPDAPGSLLPAEMAALELPDEDVVLALREA